MTITWNLLLSFFQDPFLVQSSRCPSVVQVPCQVAHRHTFQGHDMNECWLCSTFLPVSSTSGLSFYDHLQSITLLTQRVLCSRRPQKWKHNLSSSFTLSGLLFLYHPKYNHLLKRVLCPKRPQHDCIKSLPQVSPLSGPTFQDCLPNISIQFYILTMENPFLRCHYWVKCYFKTISWLKL